MRISFYVAKNMAKNVAFRYGIAYINYFEGDYYVTSCVTSNTVGTMAANGNFSCLKGKVLK